jgi:hypothetical protein
MRRFMPKFVTALAFIAATACSMAGEQNGYNAANAQRNNRKAAGLNTKAGKVLASGELCAQLKTDADGKSTVSTLLFQQNSDFLRRTRVMTTTSQFPVESESRGSWGIVNETLLLTENGTTVKNPIEIFQRESDGASCVRFVNLENRPEFCSCGF